jgi:hypothetical protein
MRTIKELWLCEDCMLAKEYDDLTHIDDYREADRIKECVRRLDKRTSNNFDNSSGDGILDFTRKTCDCCHTTLAGPRFRYAVVGE